MSFFSNCPQDRCPGRLSGNPMNGLCDKVCIQVKKVFDACMRQAQEDNVNVTLQSVTPANPAYPLTFVSARNVTTTAQITSLQVDPLPDRPNCSRVQVSYSIPVEVLYVDANGVEGKGTASVTLSQDVILYVPAPSIMPYEVEAIVSVVSPEGTYVSGNTFNVTFCTTSIIKVVMTVELLIPSYGYATIPPCQEYTQEVCSGFFELPLFPDGDGNL
ncbi:MAG: hypothetical protein IKJ14_00640 [Clostridia bacterium]|nr:hypothetical protein [Clostridia bacterium]